MHENQQNNPPRSLVKHGADKHNPDLTMEQFIIEYVKPVAEKHELYRPEPKGETQDNPQSTEPYKFLGK